MLACPSKLRKGSAREPSGSARRRYCAESSTGPGRWISFRTAAEKAPASGVLRVPTPPARTSKHGLSRLTTTQPLGSAPFLSCANWNKSVSRRALGERMSGPPEILPASNEGHGLKGLATWYHRGNGTTVAFPFIPGLLSSKAKPGQESIRLHQSRSPRAS